MDMVYPAPVRRITKRPPAKKRTYFQRTTRLPGTPRYCTHKKRDGSPCKRSPVEGTTICRAHGAGASHIQKARTAKLELATVRRALDLLDLPLQPNESPQEILLQSVASAHRQRAFLEQLLMSVKMEDLERLGEVPFPGQRIVPGARAEVIMRLLGEATKNAARTSKLALDAGLEERLVNLAEKQALAMVRVVQGTVEKLAIELKLTPSQKARALANAADELRLLAAGDGEIVEGHSVEVKRAG